MTAHSSFRALIVRVRAGDDQAAAEVIDRFGPYVRRVIRVKLNDAGLGSSSDIYQSVLANFFVRAALGAFHLDTPDDLKRLLAEMTRNKVRERIRKQRPTVPLNPSDSRIGMQIADDDSSPSQLAAFRELYQRAVALLSDEERLPGESTASGTFVGRDRK